MCKQETAEGLIKIVTLAPELPGAIAFIEKATKNGIVVAIGHTAATPEDISQAIKAGARLSTHLGNGAHKVLDRNNNYIQYQLAQDELQASFIADGFHIPFFTLTNYLRAKGTHRSVLVSDSIAAAGMGPGKYDLVGMEVEVNKEGFVSLTGTPYLAGSVLDLPRAIKNVARYTGFDPEDVVVMASHNPAELVGLECKLVLCQVDLEWGFGDSPDILFTSINGEIVYPYPKKEKGGTPEDQKVEKWADRFYTYKS